MKIKKLITSLVSLTLISVLIIATVRAENTISSDTKVDVLEQLPDGKAWLDYFTNSLMPFYFSEHAFGDPIGNFPTWRCNNGQVFDPDNPCNELVKSYNKRESIISKSRQTYFYGVAYHLSGNEQALQLAKAGVDYIRKHAIDPDTGSIATYLLGGKALPSTQYRTALQLAYGTLGMAFYYYLTRDQQVLDDIIKLKNHLFENYFDKQSNIMMWLPLGVEIDHDNPDINHLKQWQRLSAQLDQLNTFLLLLTPIIPQSHSIQWKKDLDKLADIMVNRFYDADNSRFKFTLDTLSEKEQANHKLQPNFGRSIKAMWMLHFIARITGNDELSTWVTTNAAKILNQAYIEHNGSWGYRKLEDGSADENKLSWIYIELEMMAATLALEDISYANYMIKTNPYWFDHFVDKQDHEIWTWLTPNGKVNDAFPKMLFYKKGFHSAEHALVSYITAQALRDEPVELYYAFNSEDEKNYVSPYYYSALTESRTVETFKNQNCLKKVKITFEGVY